MHRSIRSLSLRRAIDSFRRNVLVELESRWNRGAIQILGDVDFLNFERIGQRRSRVSGQSDTLTESRHRSSSRVISLYTLSHSQTSETSYSIHDDRTPRSMTGAALTRHIIALESFVRSSSMFVENDIRFIMRVVLFGVWSIHCWEELQLGSVLRIYKYHDQLASLDWYRSYKFHRLFSAVLLNSYDFSPHPRSTYCGVRGFGRVPRTCEPSALSTSSSSQRPHREHEHEHEPKPKWSHHLCTPWHRTPPSFNPLQL